MFTGKTQACDEIVVAPQLAGIVGLHGLAIVVEQAPVEVEAVGLMPAKGAKGAGEAPADRAGGIDPDQIQVTRFAVEQCQDVA
ncbi:hypothetical protein D3C76_1756820 [compost metagenome]